MYLHASILKAFSSEPAHFVALAQCLISCKANIFSIELDHLDTMLLFQLAADVERLEKEEVREETEPA